MAILSTKSHWAAGQSPYPNSIFQFRDDMLDTVPSYSEKTYRDSIPPHEQQQFLKQTVSAIEHSAGRTFLEILHREFKNLSPDKDYRDLDPHDIIEIDDEEFRWGIYSEANSTSNSYISGSAEAHEAELKRLGLFNEETGKWEVSKARIGLSMIRLKIAADLPQDLGDNPSLTQLAEYVETSLGVLNKIGKSVGRKLLAEDIPPSSVEQELGLSGQEGDDINAYYLAEHGRIHDNKSIDWEEREEQLKALRDLRTKSYIETSAYLYLDLKEQSYAMNPQPDLYVDKVFDTMFQGIIDAYQVMAQKTTLARETLVERSRSLAVPAGIGASISGVNQKPSEQDLDTPEF